MVFSARFICLSGSFGLKVSNPNSMKYELMVILDPKQTDKALEKTLKEIKGIFEENNLKVAGEDVWGHRDLSYRIKGHDTGYYVTLLFEGEPAGVPQVKKDLQIQTGILRSMLVKMPDDYILLHYEEELMQAGGKQKLSKHAEELSKKVSGQGKASKAPAKTAVADEKKLEEQLKSIVEDADIDL